MYWGGKGGYKGFVFRLFFSFSSLSLSLSSFSSSSFLPSTQSLSLSFPHEKKLRLGEGAEVPLFAGREVNQDGKVRVGEGAWVEAAAALVFQLVRVCPVCEDHHVRDRVNAEGVVKVPVDWAHRERQRAEVATINNGADQLRERGLMATSY